MYIRAHRSPLINLPGPRVNLLLGTLENLLNKDFRYFSFFQHLRKIHGPIRRTPLPLGRIGMDISDPEWVKVSTVTIYCMKQVSKNECRIHENITPLLVSGF